MSEIRLNRLTGEWVIMAPERAKRGGNLGIVVPKLEVPAYAAECPFCPGNEQIAGEERFRVPGDNGQWVVRSLVNKYSVLSPIGDVAVDQTCPGLGENVNGVGLHEVIVESPRHDLPVALLGLGQMQRILEAYLDRFRSFYADLRIRHVIIFKNHGADAGASQQHPHSQIVGTPIVPGQIVDRIERVRKYFDEAGVCLACSTIAREREEGARIVAENEQFVAFIPYAALSPYHLWIFPKKHAACFSEQAAEFLPALAEILQSILVRIHGLLGDPPFNLVLRSLSPRDADARYFHWYISIIPRVNRTAGFELGTGMYVNPSLPEERAKALREYVVK